MQQHIVLIGAGSVSFGLGTLGDVLRSKVFEGSKVTLLDINPEALKRVEAVGQRYIAENKLPFELHATTDRKEALQGATFCVISIEVGNRFELWDQDWMVPLQYGIRHVYGENGGPGGLFHSLRIIPPILDICEDVSRICPEAFVCNFSNPMSRICTTVMRKYPDLRFIGLCHEIASLPYHLPQITDVPIDNLFFRACGLNHFSVLVDAKRKDNGKDLYPEIRAKAPAYFETVEHGFDWALAEFMTPDIKKSFQRHALWVERGLFKVILEQFGYLPITTDSHFGEYIQWANDVVDHRGILDFYRAYKMYCSQKVSDAAIEYGGEHIIDIMEGIVANAGYEETAVNVMNEGFIDNLPADIAVEVPGIVDKNGVHGIKMGRLAPGLGGLLNNQYAVHDLTAEAVLKKSRKAALQALLVDPVVTSVRSAEQTLDTMLAFQNKWLGYLE
jgi:alpha-galactosidase